MDKANQYKISTETKYIKDYQSEHYRAIIADDKNRNIRTGTEWFFSEEQALADGERMLADSEAGAKLILKGEHGRQVRQALLNRDSYLHTVLNTNNCWKTLEVLKITHKKGVIK
ncbi:hypothetical protein [Lachnoclostridium phytofermentans]|uniref:Uncharacterized protein n=1 Tax=Lachnoclostridium phytofermentans (strain ATCC 700394 / DSM 18823 / ISDg) TaxID=357809 RepID=A9KK66_LACP7|nr:hypothetical protein [Lachnoclostridium phytofermentans]ABX42638.1 hypothetical protein Cphy_2277 [Lachnoclostridium phytofermentans ISDg]